LAERIPARLTAAEGRRFGVTVGLAFLGLAAVAWWRGRAHTYVVFGTVGGALTIAGLIVPTYLGPVWRAWMGLAHVLSRITTPVVLGVVYFVVLTPVAFVMRRFGSPPLARTLAGSSAWISRAPEARRRHDMERQF